MKTKEQILNKNTILSKHQFDTSEDIDPETKEALAVLDLFRKEHNIDNGVELLSYMPEENFLKYSSISLNDYIDFFTMLRNVEFMRTTWSSDFEEDTNWSESFIMSVNELEGRNNKYSTLPGYHFFMRQLYYEYREEERMTWMIFDDFNVCSMRFEDTPEEYKEEIRTKLMELQEEWNLFEDTKLDDWIPYGNGASCIYYESLDYKIEGLDGTLCIELGIEGILLTWYNGEQ